MTAVSLGMPRRMVEATIDGATVRVPEGTTIFDACRSAGTEICAPNNGRSDESARIFPDIVACLLGFCATADVALKSAHISRRETRSQRI